MDRRGGRKTPCRARRRLPRSCARLLSRPYRFAGRERAYVVPSSTHFASSRFPLTSFASRRSQPRSSRPRISTRRAVVSATSESSSPGRRGPSVRPPARGHRHVAADQKGQAAEHLLLGQPGFAGNQCADAIRELLVVGHLERHLLAPVDAGPALEVSAANENEVPDAVAW